MDLCNMVKLAIDCALPKRMPRGHVGWRCRRDWELPQRGRAKMAWVAVLIGVVVGAISGVVGIGGGILFIPALIWFFHMNQVKAQGTSLGALLAPVGIFAFY